MTIPKTKPLTDTQLVILCEAAKRKDLSVLPVPYSLKTKGGAQKRVLTTLLARGLIAEHAADLNDEVWRMDEALGRLKLVVADTGLSAVGIAPESAGIKTKLARASKRRVKKTRPVRKAIGSSHSAAKPSQPTTKPASSGAPRRETKTAILTEYLYHNDGATIDELMNASGWQAHSVRGFLSGTVRKKLGLTVISEKTDGIRRYRIAQ
jgi:hypothetical protein